MIVLSAIAATGIVFVTEPSHGEQTVGVEHVKLQDRHPAFNIGDALRGAIAVERGEETAPAPTSTPKTDRLDVVRKSCGSYTWPNIPASCLQSADGSERQRKLRQVSVLANPAERISIVTPTATIVAQR
jgi:hypothetical protein